MEGNGQMVELHEHVLRPGGPVRVKRVHDVKLASATNPKSVVLLGLTVTPGEKWVAALPKTRTREHLGSDMQLDGNVLAIPWEGTEVNGFRASVNDFLVAVEATVAKTDEAERTRQVRQQGLLRRLRELDWED